MADRNVKVVLTAQVQEYIAGMEKAAKATRETGTEAEKLAQKRDAFNMLGASAMAMGAAAAVGVGLAVSKWADFDQAMSNVQAATHESEANMKLLSNAALDAGARTVFSATESANAIEELAKAGVSTADILGGGLDGALDLAAAGNLGVAEAAGIAATALKTFNLEGKDMSHVSDLLAAGAGKAMGDVTDLSAALNQSAMVANATGLSIEETTAGLSAFASQGLLGSDAGTSFKSMLQALTPTSGKAAETMKELGISAYDSQGNFIGLAEFAGNLRGALSGLSVEQQQAALKTIFGSDAIRAATVLYSEGEAGIIKWTDAVNDQGYAAETAAARLDNLKGDLEALGGALDTALIKTGSAANDALRDMVSGLTEVIDAYNGLPPELQDLTLGIGLTTAAIGLLGGGLLLGIPKLAEFKTALSTLEVTAKSTRTALAGIAPAALALAAIPIAADLAEWVAEFRGVKLSAGEMADELKRTGDVTAELKTGLSGGAPFEALEGEAALNNLRQMNTLVGEMRANFESTDLSKAMSVSTFGIGREVGAAAENIKELDAALTQMVESGEVEQAAAGYEQFAAMATEAGWSQEKITSYLPGYAKAQGAATEATEAATEVSIDASEGYLTQADAAASLSDEIMALLDSINALNGIGQTSEQTNSDVQDSLQGLREYVAEAQAGTEGYVLSLDEWTVAGAANRAMLADHAATVITDADAQYEVEKATLGADEAVANYQSRLATGRQEIYDTALALSGNADEAQRLTDKILEMPNQAAIDVLLQGAQEAQAKLQELNAYKFAPKVLKVEEQFFRNVMYKNPADPSIPHANGGIHAYANGGINEGIYSGGEPLYKFAEQETGWEALISGKPDQRDRNRQIWSEAGSRLGMGDVLKALSGGGAGGSGTTLTQNVYPQPGMSEAEVARIAAEKMTWALKG